MSLDSIPQEMRDAPRWGVWRAMTRDGRLTKVPYSAVTGKMARSNVIEDWTSFEQAQAFKAESPLNQGLGFCLGDGWAGVDLDGCFDSDTGTVAPEAEAIIESFETYTEVSPSGTGFKLFMHGSLAEGTKGARIKAPWTKPGDVHGDIEVYSAGRYFTVTGEDWGGYGIQERSGALQELQQRYFLRGAPNATEARPSPPWQASQLQDEELWQRMFKWTNGGRIRALYDGDHSAYTSKSEADSALCCDLVFATNHDAGRVARMFAQSALADKKWERADYRELTIGGAMAVVTGDYRPGNGHSAPSSAQEAAEPAQVPVELLHLPNLPEDFWGERESLRTIRQAAHAASRSADAVLGIVLARVSGMLEPTRIDTGVGSPASLNMFVCPVGPSGSGKSDAWDIAHRLYPAMYSQDTFADNLMLGSGEGIAEAFMGSEVESGDDGKKKAVRKQILHKAFVSADEGGALVAFMTRVGNILGPVLRTAWKGAPLGQSNATTDRTRRVVDYSLGVAIGFQLTTIGPLLADSVSGTPQRFIYLSGRDPSVPTEAVRPPAQPDWHYDNMPKGAWTVAASIRSEIRAHDLAVQRQELSVPELDSHALLTRVKLAGLLAALELRNNIGEDDWRLAGIVWQTSCAVRDVLVEAVKAEAQAKAEAATKMAVFRANAIDEGKAEASDKKLQRMVDTIVKHVGQNACQGGCKKRCLTLQLAGRDRKVYPVEAVVAEALVQGWIREEGENYVTND